MHFCRALAHSIPSLSSWQKSSGSFCCHSCSIYQIVAAIFFIPLHISLVVFFSHFWAPAGSFVFLTHDTSLTLTLTAGGSTFLADEQYSTVKKKYRTFFLCVCGLTLAVCSHRVFGSSAVCSLPVKARVCVCPCRDLCLPVQK